MSGDVRQRVLILANPAARHGKGIVDAARAERLLNRQEGMEVTTLLTQRQGHAEELAAAAEGFDLVVVVGGDGSAHEAVNGLMRIPRKARPALGVVPAGSGNDYAFSLGMSPSLEEAVSQLASAPRRLVDLGTCNGRYFAETLSFGLDAAIALDTVERRERIVLCAVQVGPTYGGGFRICPDALFDDGMLDVCIAHAPVGALKAGFVFLCAKNGRHRRFREIESLRAREIVLRFEDALPVQIDGERLDATEFSIGVSPAALRVVAPSAPSAFSD